MNAKSSSEERVALVTGAARGIGAAAAIALAERGIASVLAVRDPAAAGEVRRAVEARGVRCRIERCDVADAAQVRAAIADTLQAWGRLDILVNNAGQIAPIGHIADTDPAQWAAAVTTNLVGPYQLLHAALPELARRRGVVVNLSTGAAHTPREGWSAYCSAKAGLAMLSRCVAGEYADRGVAVYSFQPGFVDTEMQGRIRSSGINEISRMPREQLAPPERSAGVVAWLADARPADLAGMELSMKDESLATRARQHLMERNPLKKASRS